MLAFLIFQNKDDHEMNMLTFRKATRRATLARVGMGIGGAIVNGPDPSTPYTVEKIAQMVGKRKQPDLARVEQDAKNFLGQAIPTLRQSLVFRTGLEKSESRQVPDLTDHYNTVLTPGEEQEFGKWKANMEATTGANLGAHDYDIRGAWKSGLQPDGNLHWDDRFKKPNHPTFSSGSIYAQQTQRGRGRAATTASEPMGRPPGGEWTDHNDDGTHWTFTPSDHVLGIRSPAQMLEYFSAYEPKNNVVIGNQLHVGTQGPGAKDKHGLEVVQREKAPVVQKSYKTPAWQRKEGQNPKGGLNAKGRASARAEGHNLKAPVKRGDNPRRASFLARMGNSPGPEYDEHGKPTRLLLSLQAWGASSKADARRKAKAISARLKGRTAKSLSAVNPPDVVHLEVPLLIRLLEYAREDAASDVDLHEVVEKMIHLSQRGNTLDMHHYGRIVKDLPE